MPSGAVLKNRNASTLEPARALPFTSEFLPVAIAPQDRVWNLFDSLVSTQPSATETTLLWDSHSKASQAKALRADGQAGYSTAKACTEEVIPAQ